MYRTAFLVIALPLIVFGGVDVHRTEYARWPNCYRISNGTVDLIVTSDIGPRIMRYGFIGGPNMLKEYKETLGGTREKDSIKRGGHRIWAAPETQAITYAPDNVPVEVEVKRDGVIATAPVESTTGLQKQMEVKMAPEAPTWPSPCAYGAGARNPSRLPSGRRQ